jgi:hypothetical protein
MRALIFTALLFTACTSRDVELFPEDASRPQDAQTFADVELAEAGNDAGGFDDATLPDAAPDAGADAAVFPDAEPAETGAACVCRYLSCRADECETMVSPGSVCDNGVCTGALGSCRTDRECATGFTCTADERSTAACP